jgi:CHAT domain-containing protein
MNIIELIISREGENIRICATDRPKQTLRPYEEKPVSYDRIDSLCSQILSILNRTNRRGDVAERLIADLKKTGQDLFDELMTETAKRALSSTSSPTLSLDIDDRLMHVPWELLHDGDNFLCRKFNVGRIISTKQSIQDTQKRTSNGPLKMLVIADPKDDLNAAYKEGIKIRDELLDREDRLKVHLVSGRVDREFVRRHIRDFDIVHYTGHAEYEENNPGRSGWTLLDGTWTSSEVMNIKGETPFPFLVFSNACHSGRTEKRFVGEEYEKKIYDLASTFLHCGVTHYIGSFLEVLDTPAALFAIEFYRAVARDMSVGEAVRIARNQLIEHYGESNIIWASYMLYGDPAYTLPYRKTETVPHTGRSSKAAYAIAFLVIVTVLYFGVNTLKGPPVIPESAEQSATAQPKADFEISFLRMVGLRDNGPEGIRDILSQGSRMYMYDQFRLYFKSNRDPYVYFLTSSSPGKVTFLVSERGVQEGDASDSEYVVPLDARLFKPDETADAESIFILASGEKLEDRQQLLWEIEKRDENLHAKDDALSEITSEATDYKFIASLELNNGRIRSINPASP